MDYNSFTLGEMLSDPRIRLIAGDAIRARDLSKEEIWNQTMAQLREAHFGGNMLRGFKRLYRAADTGDWYFPLYNKEECAACPDKKGVNLVWFPAEDPEAENRPFILLIPGGGFVNVWNLTEGWPVADHFNEAGYHVFILTYQVTGNTRILEAECDDIARGIGLIRKNAEHFRVDAKRYVTCGFSAGGYLTCLWSTREMGWEKYGLPRPEAMIPVYPVVSWKWMGKDLTAEDMKERAEEDLRLFGMPGQDAMESAFEIPEHADCFPPCALFLAAQDELVSPENSRILKRVLDEKGIPCRLEVGPVGGHGFADGEGMCMQGWPERAAEWLKSL